MPQMLFYNCLKRSGILFKYQYINKYVVRISTTNNLDILTKTYLNTDRFCKDRQRTIMSCDEVQ
jgi:hypothetical protein